LTATLRSLAVDIAHSLGITLGEVVRDKIALWLARLEEWNARIDLTAARTPEELVDLMLADAFVLAARIPQDAGVVDVGTGAGAPGLALALVRRDLRVTLVEPQAKRASFLRTVIGEVDRADVVIERVRGESMPLNDGQRVFDVAVSRATLPPAAWLDLGTRMVAPGGTIWLLVARDDPPNHARARLEEDFAYTWPLTGARRRALAYQVLEGGSRGDRGSVPPARK
jgi:16S rRNA (guanine527-N7)-methyltransferase